jgi:hypothetical protein
MTASRSFVIQVLSNATDSLPAQADTSCLVPYALLAQCLSSLLEQLKPGPPMQLVRSNSLNSRFDGHLGAFEALFGKFHEYKRLRPSVALFFTVKLSRIKDVCRQ